MFRVDKNGNITFAPAAIATIVVLAVGFGGWMTKMTIDVSQIYDVAERTKKMELSLAGAGITKVQDPQWPQPDPSSPQQFSALPSPSRVAVTKRE
jgi:hypothetical protein